MATQLSTVHSRAGHSLTKPQFERRRSTWFDLSWRPAAAIAGLAVCAAMMGGLIWPTRFASNESVSVATAAMSVVNEVAAGRAEPQAHLPSSAVDAAAPLGFAETNSVSTASDQTASNEDPSKTGATSLVELKSSGAAVDQQAAGSEEPKSAPPIVAEVTAAREPGLGETQKTGNDATEAALFREFLQWRTARVSGVAPNVRHNAAESHYRARPAATQTAAVTNSQPRSRPPLSAAQATPTTSPVASPRRPHPGNTTRAAIDQGAPASATARGGAVRSW